MNATALENRPTVGDCWEACEDLVMRRMREAKDDALLFEGRVTQITITIPVHGVKPGHPILGVSRK